MSPERQGTVTQAGAWLPWALLAHWLLSKAIVSLQIPYKLPM